MVLYIAADPGKDGAIACIDQDSKLISRISTPRISASGPVDLTKEYVFCSDKVMEASKVNTKKTSLACAKRLWPNDTFVKNERCKTAHDGIVDAMLIAEATRRTI